MLKPNEAMFEKALEKGSRIGMIATFRASVASMEAEFAEEAGAPQSRATIRTVLVEEAMTHLRAGDAERHNRLVAKLPFGAGRIATRLCWPNSPPRAPHPPCGP